MLQVAEGGEHPAGAEKERNHLPLRGRQDQKEQEQPPAENAMVNPTKESANNRSVKTHVRMARPVVQL